MDVNNGDVTSASVEVPDSHRHLQWNCKKNVQISDNIP